MVCGAKVGCFDEITKSFENFFLSLMKKVLTSRSVKLNVVSWMKGFLILFVLLGSLSAQAQIGDVQGFDDFDFRQRVKREACIRRDGEQSSPSEMSRVKLHHKDAALQAKGTPEIVVCLANMSDARFSVAATEAELKALFDRFFNGQGVQGQIGHNVYSVYEYFEKNSMGQFTPHFNIMEPVSVEMTLSAAKNNRAGFRNAALSALAPQIVGRVGDFDTNGDGKVDGVIIVFADAGANTGGAGPHACCWDVAASIGGVSYATQLLVPELLQEGVLNGIGVCVHEMSHMLGLPDMYDNNGSGYVAPGMDVWSLMDYGEYVNAGFSPTPFTAYEKSYFGWITLKELSEPVTVTSLKSVAAGGDAYIVYNEADRGEYYILENRTYAGTGGDLMHKPLCDRYGDGLMIYHIDEDEGAWSSNRVNVDPARQRITIVPANGHFELLDNFKVGGSYTPEGKRKYYSELAGHTWPLKDTFSSRDIKDGAIDVIEYFGIRGNNELNDEERVEGDRVSPAAVLYNPNSDGEKLMHKPITDIVQNTDNTVSFKFMGGGDDDTSVCDIVDSAPELYEVYNVSGQRVDVGRGHGQTKGVFIMRDSKTKMGRLEVRF